MILPAIRSILLILCCVLLYGSASAQKKDAYLFIGTYTDGGSKGIYVYTFNVKTGSLKYVSEAAAENPSYLTVSPDGKYVYAVNENNPAGEVSAYAFNAKTGKLSFLNKQSAGGGSPCYITLDKKGVNAVVANYMGGNLAVLPIKKNGQLGAATQIINHHGSSIVSSRQEAAHVHTAVFSPDYKSLLVTDLGTDELYFYPVVSKPGKQLLDTNAIVAKTTEGAGPRHVVFHPTLPICYVMEELSGQVSVYRYNKKGRVKMMQTLLNDTINPRGQCGSADIHLSPDAKFLYASNRYEANNIGIYSIDPLNGFLTAVGYEATGGRKPRNFTISKDGRFLLAANQETDNITLFSRDPKTGKLSAAGTPTTISRPVCLQWWYR